MLFLIITYMFIIEYCIGSASCIDFKSLLVDGTVILSFIIAKDSN